MKMLYLTLALVSATLAADLAQTASSARGSAARASDRVMVLKVDGDGVKAPERAKVDASVEAAIRSYPGLTAVPAPEGDITDLMIELECVDLDGDCLGAIGARGGADRVLHVALAKKGARFKATARWVVTATKAIARTDEAEVAAVHELPAAVEGLLVAALGPRAAAKPPEPQKPPAQEPPTTGPQTPETSPPGPASSLPRGPQGTVIVETNRVQAQIFVGDEYAGTGSATLELPPGRHLVRITHPGDESQIVTVEVEDGRTVTRQVALEAAKWTQTGPAPVGGLPRVEARRSGTWLVWVIVGAVVVAGAATGAALAAGGAGEGATGTLVLGLGQDGAWMDPATQRGRR